MATYFYLQIPNDDTVLEFSNDEKRLNTFYKSILDLKKIANKEAIQVIYDNENVKLFNDTVKDLATFTVKNKLGQFIGKSALDFRIKPQQKNDVSYFLWLLNICKVKPLNGNILAEIPEQWNEDDNFLIVNFSNEYDNQKRKFLPIFKDAWHQTDIPIFFKIDFVTSFEDLELWLATSQKSNFSLLDRSRFEKTNHTFQGARIFQEHKTKRHWYLDMLHKDHYEVFDNTGKTHLGVADLNGNIDSEKAIKKRKIDFII